MSKSVFTSESVCAGHPDKVCDQISDAIVDAALEADPNARVAVEALVTLNQIVLAGEVTANAEIDFEAIARREIKRIGYTEPKWGFSDQSALVGYIHAQSAEIAVGVDDSGAGDQGMMFGYACRDTAEFMPLPIALAHALVAEIDELRESKKLAYLRPDGKAQVSIEYQDGKPIAVQNVVLAVPHDEETSLEQVKTDLYNEAVVRVLAKYDLSIDTKDLVCNGTGVWHNPGPASDTGLTGRKIIVDSYGGFARVGGGAFSGKDPSKVDRSGAYAARFLAKNIVAAGLADKVEVALAYFIGAKKPVMQEYETFGTAKAAPSEISAFADKLLDTSVTGIIEGLNLRRPIYLNAAAYGHFGRSEFPWEKLIS
ncbi:MAG: methionine adenosyltransferase [Candidatus Saccharimonadia bacterium]